MNENRKEMISEIVCSFLFLSFTYSAPSLGNGAGVNDLGNGAKPQHDYPVPINPPQPIGGKNSGKTRVRRKIYWNDNQYFGSHNAGSQQYDYSRPNSYIYRFNDNSRSQTSYYNRNSFGYPVYDDPNGSFHIGDGAYPQKNPINPIDPNNGGNGEPYYNPYENHGFQRIDFNAWGK